MGEKSKSNNHIIQRIDQRKLRSLNMDSSNKNILKTQNSSSNLKESKKICTIEEPNSSIIPKGDFNNQSILSQMNQVLLKKDVNCNVNSFNGSEKRLFELIYLLFHSISNGYHHVLGKDDVALKLKDQITSSEKKKNNQIQLVLFSHNRILLVKTKLRRRRACSIKEETRRGQSIL